MGIVTKLLTIGIFATILYFLIDYIQGLFGSMISISSFSATSQYFICKFGILHAVNVFVSLFIAGWFTNKLLDYLR